MVSFNEFKSLFTITDGKIQLFAIILLSAISLILFVPLKTKKTKGTVLEYFVVRKSHPYYGVIIGIVAIMLFGVLYMSPRTPSFSHEAQTVLGNESNNISNDDYIRLKYLSDHFVIVKYSTQDTPSCFDADGDLNIDNNRKNWQTKNIIPKFDTYINHTGDWTVIHCEMFWPTNGASPLQEKHLNDYQWIEFYFYKNQSAPTYVAFETYVGLTEHPKEFVPFGEIQKIENNLFALRLDADTNAFAESWNEIPTVNHNIRPTFVSPTLSDSIKYLSDFQKGVVYGSFFGVIFLTAYSLAFSSGFTRFRLFFIVLLTLTGLYYLITLQFDFVGNISFRVWEDSQHPNDQCWYDSESGRDYIDGYGGLPHDRARWTQPAFELGGM